MDHYVWNAAEKKIARNAFDKALRTELDEILHEARTRMAAVKDMAELWDLHHHLGRRRDQIDERYDYRYSRLIELFAILISERRLSLADLAGLEADKLDRISSMARPVRREGR